MAAQKALSAVYRTGQRFGVAYLVDLLMGRANDRIAGFGHDRLKTFGVGARISPRANGTRCSASSSPKAISTVDIEGHGGLRLGETAPAVLRGEVPVAFRGDEAEPAARGRARRGRAASDSVIAADAAPGDEALWQALRALRLEIAREQGVPPYVIFHDATLLAMVRARPRDLAALGQFAGVGASKLERYGERFLAAITAG